MLTRIDGARRERLYTSRQMLLRYALGVSSCILSLMLPAAVLAPAAESREAAAASARLTADQIITRAVELADRLREQEDDLRYEFLEQAIREKFDPAGRTKEHEEVTAKVYPLAGTLYREVVEKNGHPLSSKEIKFSDLRNTQDYDITWSSCQSQIRVTCSPGYGPVEMRGTWVGGQSSKGSLNWTSTFYQSFGA